MPALLVMIASLVVKGFPKVAILYTSTGESCVGIGVHEELHVKELSDFRKVEDKNAFEKHHVGWIDADVLIRFPITKQPLEPY